MGIEVEWVGEDGVQLRQVPDSGERLAKLMHSHWSRSNTVCLRFVDPYGDTTFNQAQIPVLLEELRASERAESNPGTRDHLAGVIRLVESAVRQVHTYIKFIGD